MGQINVLENFFFPFWVKAGLPVDAIRKGFREGII